MADPSVLRYLDRVELIELVSVLARRIGDLPDRALAEARVRAAEQHVVRRSAVVSDVFADYVRTRELHEKATAEKDRSALGRELARLATAHRVACDREREALDRLTRARMELDR